MKTSRGRPARERQKSKTVIETKVRNCHQKRCALPDLARKKVNIYILFIPHKSKMCHRLPMLSYCDEYGL